MTRQGIVEKFGDKPELFSAIMAIEDAGDYQEERKDNDE